MTRTTRLLAWFSTQTRIVQCFTVAILLHTAIVCILGTMKFAASIRTNPSGDKFTGEIHEGEIIERPVDGGGGEQATQVPTPGPVGLPHLSAVTFHYLPDYQTLSELKALLVGRSAMVQQW